MSVILKTPEEKKLSNLELIEKIDEVLMDFEDWMHGEDGNKCTQARVYLIELKSRVGGNLDLQKLRQSVLEALEKEKEESLREWFLNEREIIDIEKDGKEQSNTENKR